MSIQVSMPQRIVVAVDGSDPSLKALVYSAKLAGLTKSKVKDFVTGQTIFVDGGWTAW